nr:probable LRR receptor-like serine/threonine-protein kinase At1g74360 [Oryza sativa Japonica Group]
MSTNTLGGNMQEILGKFVALKYLVLHHNDYTGSIVSSNVLRLPLLARLDLSFNQFSGELPLEVVNMKSLKYVMLLANNFSGGIPATYPPFNFVYTVMMRENCRSIWVRLLKGYGIIPICTNSSSPVRSNTISGYVQLSGNKLSGEIPSQIGAMRNLSLLHLDNNQLTGHLPPEISQLPLVVLNVSSNIISGRIITGMVMFIMANLRVRFPVDQDPNPESLSCENPKCGGGGGKCGAFHMSATSSPPSGCSSSCVTGCSRLLPPRTRYSAAAGGSIHAGRTLQRLHASPPAPPRPLLGLSSLPLPVDCSTREKARIVIASE